MMKTFYRGAKSLRSEKPTHWAFNRRIAEIYAKEHGGKVFVAHITPRKYMVGPESDVAKALGIYREWVKARQSSFSKADTLLHNAAKRAGADAILYSNQIVVLNPKIIHLIKS